MGRPATRSQDLVAVSIDGKGAAWCDGYYAGDPDIVTYARRAARIGMPVLYRGTEFEAGDKDALGALISLIAYSPGRALVTDAPAFVLGALSALEELDPAAIFQEG